MLLHIQKLGSRNAVIFELLYYSQNCVPYDGVTACAIWINARLTLKSNINSTPINGEKHALPSWLTYHGPQWVCFQSSSVSPTPDSTSAKSIETRQG